MQTATLEAPSYVPKGAAFNLFHLHHGEVLISGPAGTGKSRACLEKLHLLAERCPGMRGLIVRKTRESLTEAALVTFEDRVLPPNHPVLQTGGQRRVRQAYTYPNGSTIVVGGLDKASKIMSTEYDVIYVQEAIELLENDWESLTTRLRNGVVPYQQLIADTNPDAPTHWLRKRCASGRTVLLDSRHEDNPVLYRDDRWTEAGKRYIDGVLERLTGPRYHRLRHGRWVQAEGVVYDGWDRTVHLIDRFTPPREWARYWSVDFGYTNPFVCQWWAKDGDGRLYCYREIYHSQRLVEDHAKRMLELSGWRREGGELKSIRVNAEPLPTALICDHDAEDMATLRRYLGLGTLGAKKALSPGIQAVAGRLRRAGDGKPRLFLMRDIVDERDPALGERKLPQSTEEEFDAYIWDESNNRKKGEEPLKENDHGMDALRYLVAHLEVPKFDAPPPPERDHGPPTPFHGQPLRRLDSGRGRDDSRDREDDESAAHLFMKPRGGWSFGRGQRGY